MNRRFFLLAAPSIVIASNLMAVSTLDPALLAVWQMTPSGMEYRYQR